MDAKIKPFRITICMVRTESNNADTISKLLEILEESPIAIPTHYSKHERGSLEYNRKQLLELIQSGNVVYEFYVFRRKKEPRYEASIDIGPRPFIDIEFNPTTAEKYWPDIFNLTHALVGIFKPDLAAVHIWPPYDRDSSVDYSKPLLDGVDKEYIDFDLMHEAAYIVPASYRQTGPTGLAMRTYFGPHYVKQIGAKFLQKTPAIVSTVFDDIIQVDLTEKPWLLDKQSLLSHWRKAVNHIKKSKVFPAYIVKPSGWVEYLTEGRTCEIWDQKAEEKNKQSVNKKLDDKQEKIKKLCDQISLSSKSAETVANINISKLTIPLASFEECNLECLKANKTILHAASFTDAILIDCDFIEADLKNASFTEATITESNFSNADLQETNWQNTELFNCVFNDTNFKKADLSGASMEDCIFANADFRGADLSNGNFSGSDFRGANLKGANVKSAKFKGCLFDK